MTTRSHHYGAALLLSGKDAKICVFQLSDFEGDFNELPLNRTTIKEQKIERTKGAFVKIKGEIWTRPKLMHEAGTLIIWIKKNKKIVM